MALICVTLECQLRDLPHYEAASPAPPQGYDLERCRLRETGYTFADS